MESFLVLLSSSLHFQTRFAALNSTVLKNNYREAVMRSTYLLIIIIIDPSQT